MQLDDQCNDDFIMLEHDYSEPGDDDINSWMQL